MSTQGRSNSLDDVLKLITRLARKSADGNYLFRGEPECYARVSSRLYRRYCKEADNPGFDIEVMQRENITEAKRYTKETDDLEILTALQHYGGKTNLIDFTTDYLIALFFSCDGSPETDGRVILLREAGRVDLRVIRPRSPANRVIAQKSVFVKPTKGYVVPDALVPVPPGLKQPILEYLRTRHGISTETIYNDLFGFIRIQDLHQSAYAEFYKGLSSWNEGNRQQAIGHYSKSIELNPQMPGPYNNRGDAYSQEGDIDRALQDYDKALALDPKHPLAYENRGIAWLCLSEWAKAKSDLETAKRQGLDIVATFHADYGGIADFEQKHGVKLPADIKSILT